MRGHRAASPAAIEERPLTGVSKVTGLTQATGDSPAADELSVDANQARRTLVVSGVATVVASRADPLRMVASALRTVGDTLAAEVTVAADTAASAECPV
jgi:hypothetical protein